MPGGAVALRAEDHEADGRRELGLFHGIGQAADRGRNADASRQAEELGGCLLDAVQMRAAARDYDLGEDHVVR